MLIYAPLTYERNALVSFNVAITAHILSRVLYIGMNVNTSNTSTRGQRRVESFGQQETWRLRRKKEANAEAGM